MFLVTGGGAMHLNESLARCHEIEPVCNSHEQASAIAAENYGKATNHLGVAIVTTGPGRNQRGHRGRGRMARFHAVPVHVGTGEAARPDVRCRRHAARHAATGSSGSRHRFDRQADHQIRGDRAGSAGIRYHMEKAVYLAHYGTPGPVWIDIPLDVQAIQIDPDGIERVSIRPNCGSSACARGVSGGP